MPAKTEKSSDSAAIRHFTIPVTPEEELAALRQRVSATRWPDKELVADHSQGVQLGVTQELARYWSTEYDWRQCEQRLGALPHFMTEIDGLDIHFIHVRSEHENALPLIITHGWPGSVIELLKIIDPLANPTAHCGNASDAFDVVIPSMPGYGFSGKPRDTGWDPDHIARAWVELMKRLGYTHFVAQGGDWGAIITDVMATQAPPELLGMHTNMPGSVPPEVSQAIRFVTGGPAPSGLSADEQRAWDQLNFLYTRGVGYAVEMATQPETLYGVADSPVGLAAWMINHDAASYQDIADAFAGHPVGDLTRDDVLDNVTFYWLTNTGVSSGRLYSGLPT
jgi:pimeloyl-ACP methyl ester carboxylesterase